MNTSKELQERKNRWYEYRLKTYMEYVCYVGEGKAIPKATFYKQLKKVEEAIDCYVNAMRNIDTGKVIWEKFDMYSLGFEIGTGIILYEFIVINKN